MKNKKKLLIAGASAASLVALGLGAFAFFYDEVETMVESKVGFIDVDVTGNITHTQLKRELVPRLMASEPIIDTENPNEITKEQVLALFETAPDNLNPGDNEMPDDYVHPGTDHEIELNIQNTGNKSIRTRILIEVSSEDGSLSPRDLRKLNLYFDPYNTIAGLSSAAQLAEGVFVIRKDLSEIGTTEDGVVFILDQETVENVYNLSGSPEINLLTDAISPYVLSGLILSGTGENAETELFKSRTMNIETGEIDTVEQELPSSGTIKLDLGLDKNAGDIFEGKKIILKITVQGMQFRNTNNNLWEDLFVNEFVVGE
jgi:hypothetical protein